MLPLHVVVLLSLFRAPVRQPMPPNIRYGVEALAATAAADEFSTLVSVEHGGVEANPLYAWMQPHSHVGMMAIQGAFDATTIWLIAKTPYIRRHPKLATAGYVVAAAFRTWLTVRNIGISRWCTAHRCPVR